MAYQGEIVTIGLGSLGLVTDLPPSDIPAGSIVDCNNITLFSGYIEKERGSRKYNSVALDGEVSALYDWVPNNHTQNLIAATSTGKIYRDIGDSLFMSGVPINTGLNPLRADCKFIEAGNETAGSVKKLFLFSHNNQIKVYSESLTSFQDISNPAADWTSGSFPKVGVVHRNRLWAFYKNTAYASLTGDHEDFISSGNLLFNIFPGEGNDINGAIVFKGRLFVFKEGGFIYFLDDSDASSDNWFFKKLGSGFELSSQNAIVQSLDDLISGNRIGSISSFRAVQSFGDIESGDILSTNNVEDYVRKKTTTNGLNFQHGIYYEEKKQVLFTYKSKYGTNNDTVLTIDMNIQGRPRFSISNKDNPNCFALRRDIDGIKRPIYGDSSGFIFFMDQEDRLSGGSAYEGSFSTSNMDFRQLNNSLSSKEKHFDWISIEYISEGPHTLLCDSFVDGEYKETISFKMQTKDIELSKFVLGTDKLSNEAAFNSPRVPLHGTGRRIYFKFKNSGSNQNFRILSMTIGFRLSGGNATRI